MPDTSAPALPSTRSGCLSEEEVAQVRGARPGEVPEALAEHLAGCERCHERALFGPARRARRRREMPSMPTPVRALVLLAVMAVVLVAFFITLQRLVARF